MFFIFIKILFAGQQFWRLLYNYFNLRCFRSYIFGNKFFYLYGLVGSFEMNQRYKERPLSMSDIIDGAFAVQPSDDEFVTDGDCLEAFFGPPIDGRMTHTKFGPNGEVTEIVKFGPNGEVTEMVKFGPNGEVTEMVKFGPNGEVTDELTQPSFEISRVEDILSKANIGEGTSCKPCAEILKKYDNPDFDYIGSLSTTVDYLFFFFTFTLFLLGIFCFIFSQKNLIILLVSTEIMLLSATLDFLYVSFVHNDYKGYVYALSILVLSAAEAAVGLSIIINYFFIKKDINLDSIRSLRG